MSNDLNLIIQTVLITTVVLLIILYFLLWFYLERPYKYSWPDAVKNNDENSLIFQELYKKKYPNGGPSISSYCGSVKNKNFCGCWAHTLSRWNKEFNTKKNIKKVHH